MEQVFFPIAIIIVVCAVSATLGIFSRQPIVVAYIAAGILLGPWGFSVVENIELINEISHIGVIMLLFLAGVVLHPQRLLALFRKTMLITVTAGLICTAAITVLLLAWHFPPLKSLLAGVALLFSSTILVVKLLPTTTLHQQRMGSLCIAVLVAQDLLAITILLFMNADRPDSLIGHLLMPLSGIAGIALVMLGEQFVIRPIMKKTEYYHEVLLLLALGWCFGIAMLSDVAGFSHEIGAFIAGLSLARSPIAFFISEGLKFFRDFFLVLFFFTLGARIDLSIIRYVWAPALMCAVLLLGLKPLLYRWLFMRTGENGQFSTEIGIRLGQSSEFSLIVAVVAVQHTLIGVKVSQLVQVTTIFTMIISSYITVAFFPSPLGVKGKLKQD
jgi:glutathione-regulated potassium-efflux system ancillary protein KefC